MALKLSVGISQKNGLSDYGSLGASCSLELELAGSLQDDLEGLQRQIRQAYTACRQAVQEELARHGQNGEPRREAAKPAEAANQAGNGARAGVGASDKQLGYARQLAGQFDGLGVRKLESLAQKMFRKPVDITHEIQLSFYSWLFRQVTAALHRLFPQAAIAVSGSAPFGLVKPSLLPSPQYVATHWYVPAQRGA